MMDASGMLVSIIRMKLTTMGFSDYEEEYEIKSLII